MNEEILPMAWPDVTRLCFGPGEPHHLNADIGVTQYHRRGMSEYIDGYRQAAVDLFMSISPTRARPDHLVFPLAFLWRHHLELALKDTIAMGRQIAGEPSGFPSRHGLLLLWHEARPHIIRCGDPSAPELVNVEANLTEFDTIDPGSDGFRYPLNWDPTEASLPNEPAVINLQVLHDGMEAVAKFLSAVRSELSVRLDYTLQMEAEMESAYGHRED